MLDIYVCSLKVSGRIKITNSQPLTSSGWVCGQSSCSGFSLNLHKRCAVLKPHVSLQMASRDISRSRRTCYSEARGSLLWTWACHSTALRLLLPHRHLTQPADTRPNPLSHSHVLSFLCLFYNNFTDLFSQNIWVSVYCDQSDFEYDLADFDLGKFLNRTSHETLVTSYHTDMMPCLWKW